MTNPQTEARAIARRVLAQHGFNNPFGAEESACVDAIATALEAQAAELAAVKEDLFQSRNFWSDELSKINAKLAEAKAEVARYWTSADMKPWCDLAEEKGIGHFGKKLRGMFSRAIKAEDDARAEYERAERAEERIADLEELIAAQHGDVVVRTARLLYEKDDKIASLSAQLAEANKALEEIENIQFPGWEAQTAVDHCVAIARRAREAQGGE